MPIKNQLLSLMGKTEQPVKAAPAPAAKPAPNRSAPTLNQTEIQQIAEASLSPQLLRKLLSDEKLSIDDQKAVTAVCKQVGLL